MLFMRTTVTLEPDVERMLREAMHGSRSSFKETLNQAVRRGLGGKFRAGEAPFRVDSKAMGLRAGVDPASFNQLCDDLEADAFLETTAKLLRERKGS